MPTDRGDILLRCDRQLSRRAGKRHPRRRNELPDGGDVQPSSGFAGRLLALNPTGRLVHSRSAPYLFWPSPDGKYLLTFVGGRRLSLETWTGRRLWSRDSRQVGIRMECGECIGYTFDAIWQGNAILVFTLFDPTTRLQQVRLDGTRGWRMKGDGFFFGPAKGTSPERSIWSPWTAALPWVVSQTGIRNGAAWRVSLLHCDNTQIHGIKQVWRWDSPSVPKKNERFGYLQISHTPAAPPTQPWGSLLSPEEIPLSIVDLLQVPTASGPGPAVTILAPTRGETYLFSPLGRFLRRIDWPVSLMDGYSVGEAYLLPSLHLLELKRPPEPSVLRSLDQTGKTVWELPLDEQSGLTISMDRRFAMIKAARVLKVYRLD